MLKGILNRIHADATKKRKEEPKMTKLPWKILTPIAASAACAVIAFAMLPTILTGGNNGSNIGNNNGSNIGSSNSLTLERSSDSIKAAYVDEAPDNGASSIKLLQMTEEELFNSYQTDIFSGTVKSVRNIELLIGGEKNYYAVIEITVDQTFRGSSASGDTVSILVDYPINISGMEREDTSVTRSITEGMRGIFMPLKYDESQALEVDGEKLYWTDLANYSFPDGERYAFLESQDGLIFDRTAYASIQDAKTLEDIEQYVTMMLEKA
jgi:hypothetical protein